MSTATLSVCDKETKIGLNFKETELRLGLPGSDSSERKKTHGVSLFGKQLKEEAGNNGFPSQIPSSVSSGKRGFYDAINEVGISKKDVLFSSNVNSSSNGLKSCSNGIGSNANSPASKAQMVGWPPIRSFRKNATIAANPSPKANEITEISKSKSCLYVKVSMDGAPYLRKIDLKAYNSYSQLSSSLEEMFSCFTIGQCVEGKERFRKSLLMDLLHDNSEYVLTYEDRDGDWMLVGDVPWEMFTESCKRMRIMRGSDAIIGLGGGRKKEEIRK